MQPTRLTLAWVLRELNNRAVNYRVTHRPELASTQVHILASNVELHFEPGATTDDRVKPHQYRMVAFGLSHPDYQRS